MSLVSIVTFAWPQLLWLLLVPLALLVIGLVRRRAAGDSTHEKILRAEAGPHSLRLATAARSAPSRARPWLCLALALGVFAVARPQWGRLEEPVFDQAREILIAIDLSRSMLAPDVKPSRLERAKLLTQSLLEKLSGERVGLIVFSGTAFLQSPLSSDYEILREFLPALDPTFLPEGGTNYAALINTALTAFGATGAADRFLIVLSDGEATEDDWRSQVAELKTRGIRVIALGVGTTAGAMIPDGAGGLVKDERGAVVLSKLESNTLRELAAATSGVYEDASTWVDLAAVLAATVEAGQKGQFLEKNTIRLVERFQWPLALALWFLLVSLYYEFPVRPKSREVTLRADAPAAPPPAGQRKHEARTAVSALLFLLLVPVALPPTSARAAEPAAPPEPPLLSKIVTRLANANQRSARDWAEFGRETVTWGKRLQSGQQPVPEGPVRDALAAVELGSALDATTTDWSKLREELEALLQKPEDQQKQQQQQQQQNQDQQKQDQQKQDQQQQQQQKDQSSQPQEKPEQTEQQQQSSPQQEKSPPEQPPRDAQNQSAFGKMEQQPPPPDQTQKVGGVPERKPGEQKPPTDPALALPLQKLDQLRDKDSPAELFQLMEDPKQATPRKKTKDW